MSKVLDGIGRLIARYLDEPVAGYEPFTPSDPEALRQSLQPGDVLLVEGNARISGVIKYFTQSTWSHSALFVGPITGRFTAEGEPHVLMKPTPAKASRPLRYRNISAITRASAGRSASPRPTARSCAPTPSTGSALPMT